MAMKAKPEKVYVLRFSQDRTINLLKAVKLNSRIVLCNRWAYLRYSANDGLRMYLLNRLKREEGSEIPLEDVYRDYFDFCNEHGLPIMPVDTFVRKFGEFVEIREDRAVGVTFVDRTVRVVHDSDVYLFKKGRRKIPVYVVIEGVPTTVTFDTLRGYALNSDGELVTFDDETLANVISEATTMGATLGTQKLMWDVKLLIVIAIVLSIISLYMAFQNSMMLDKVVKMLGKML